MDSTQKLDPNSIEYWKEQASNFERKANELQQELDEYTENSAQLERELEASLGQVENQNRDLERQNQRLKMEIEQLRNKLDRSQHETNALENELQALKKEKEKQAIYVREIEQKNDDLERGQRVISESVACIEQLLNQAYERNAVLESEVDEIENLRIKLQRANDEARDLKQELKVVEKIPTPKKEDSAPEVCNGHTTARAQVEIETQTSIASPQRREINGNAMTPSSRVSAINLVGDLLRKVGLERFLCRECGKVKCACFTEQSSPPHEFVDQKESENSIDSVELRKPELKPHIETRQRCSDQPFQRSIQNDGKLRRSFIVRSREGLENFLNLKKGQEKEKTNLQF